MTLWLGLEPNPVRAGQSSKRGLWWGRMDLNHRPISYEPTALTTELRPLQRTRLSDESIAELGVSCINIL